MMIILLDDVSRSAISSASSFISKGLSVECFRKYPDCRLLTEQLYSFQLIFYRINERIHFVTDSNNMQTEAQPQNPLDKEPKPPFPQQNQLFPGSEAEMQPRPDFGENSYKGCGKLEGRVALITGADSGIGRAVALAYAREGADILISYLEEEQDAQETERLVTEAGRRAVRMAGDIGDENHCQRLVQRAIQEFGHLDILVNNAAYQKTAESIDALASNIFDRTFKTNVYAMFYLCKAAIPQMKPGSSIINTTSVQAYQPSAELLAYSATKGAIVTFTKSLAKMAAGQGIRVNAGAPGPVWTPLIVSTSPDEQQVSSFGKQDPLGRPAQPAELAPVYVLLASNEASYITGAVYEVTGGTPTA